MHFESVFSIRFQNRASESENYPMRNEPEGMARFQYGTSLDG